MMKLQVCNKEKIYKLKTNVKFPYKEEQEKSITITSNGTSIVTPDDSKSLSKVTIITNVPDPLTVKVENNILIFEGEASVTEGELII